MNGFDVLTIIEQNPDWNEYGVDEDSLIWSIEVISFCGWHKSKATLMSFVLR